MTLQLFLDVDFSTSDDLGRSMKVPKSLRSASGGLFSIGLLVLSLSVILGMSLTCDFVSLDDNVNVLSNVWLRRPLGEALLRFWRAPFENLYIPFAYTVWWFAAAASRLFHDVGLVSQPLAPSVFHGLNFFLHVANTLFVVRILTVLLKGRRFLAFFGAAIFALSPVQMETLTWISCLRDLLATFLSLLAICLLLRPEVRALTLVISTLAACLAMLSKPNAIVLPLVAAIILGGAGLIKEKRRLGLLALWMSLALPMIVINKSQQLDGGLQFVPAFWQRPIIAWDAIGSYLKIILAPYGLAPDYGRSPAMVLGHGMPVTVIVTLDPNCYRFHRAGAQESPVSLLPFYSSSAANPGIHSLPVSRIFNGSGSICLCWVDWSGMVPLSLSCIFSLFENAKNIRGWCCSWTQPSVAPANCSLER